MVVENGDSDWFRWVLGGLVAATTAISTWLATLYVGQSGEISALKTRITVLEQRPHIDPIEYTRAITNMANAIKSLTEALERSATERKDQMASFERRMGELMKEVQELRNELMVPG